MMKTRRLIGCLWLVISILPILSSCNNEDDVIKIFTGKTWKLTSIATEGSHKQFDFWGGNDAAFAASMEALRQERYFILNFEGGDLNGIAGGSFGGRGISASVSGKWNANGESRKLNIAVDGTPTERDVLGKAFIDGLQNVIRYEGDEMNLYIYYKDGQTVKFMSFRAK